MNTKTYQLEITQTLQRIVTLEAESLDHALIEINRKLKDEVIVLDENDYLDTDIRQYKTDDQNTNKT